MFLDFYWCSLCSITDRKGLHISGRWPIACNMTFILLVLLLSSLGALEETLYDMVL